MAVQPNVSLMEWRPHQSGTLSRAVSSKRAQPRGQQQQAVYRYTCPLLLALHAFANCTSVDSPCYIVTGSEVESFVCMQVGDAGHAGMQGQCPHPDFKPFLAPGYWWHSVKQEKLLGQGRSATFYRSHICLHDCVVCLRLFTRHLSNMTATMDVCSISMSMILC